MKTVFTYIIGILLLAAFPTFAGRDAGQLMQHEQTILAVKKQKDAEALAKTQGPSVAGRAGPEGREGPAGEPAKLKFRGGHPKDVYPRF